MDQDMERRLFRAGIEQFNAGQYFHAHDTWEEIWRVVTGRHKMFYQGLIQLAVALHHLERGNHRGAEKLIATARQRWADLPECYAGLELSVLLNAVGRRIDAHNPGAARQSIDEIRIALNEED